MPPAPGPRLPPGPSAAPRARGVVPHASAAQYWGMEAACAPDVVHVTVPHGAWPPPQEPVRHHWRTVFPDEIVGAVTSPLRTVLGCAATLPFGEALAIADSALRLRFVSADGLIAAAGASRGPGRRRRLAVARTADRRADDPFEPVLRAIVLGTGISGFEPQAEVPLPGYLAHADLGDRRRRIAVEAEGYAYHGSRAGFARDCRRHGEMTRCGRLVLRFTWDVVMFEPEWVAAVVRGRDERGYLSVRTGRSRRCRPG